MCLPRIECTIQKDLYSRIILHGLQEYWSVCTPQWCYIHFNIDLCFITHCIMHSHCHLSAPLKSECLLLLSRRADALCSLHFNTSVSKPTYSHMHPSFKITPRTYNALTIQSKVNIEWRRHGQVLFLQRIFLLCALFVLPFKEAWKYHFFSSRLLSIPFGKHWFCSPLWFLCSTSKHGSV